MENILSIKKFLGLNEAPDGDTKLRDGELSVMKNFKITRDNHLQLRPGSRTMVRLSGLWEQYYSGKSAPTTQPRMCGVWRGVVDGKETVLAAYGGLIFRVDDAAWTAEAVGECTQDETEFFGFGNKVYLLNGHEYMEWSGTGRFTSVEGYIPIVKTACTPGGDGYDLENVNRLTNKRRVKFSPNGTATVFQLPETDISGVVKVEGTSVTYTVDKKLGALTFASAVAAGVNSVTVTYTKGEAARDEVLHMHYAEFYNGRSDTRVFLYGDGSNRAIYSGIDYNGIGRGDYFPDLFEMRVGESNTPITGLVRHFDRMVAFKSESAYSVYYEPTTVATGQTIPNFYISTVNRQYGNEAAGQARIVENNPLTLGNGSIYEWVATNRSGNITDNQNNCKRISDRVEESIAGFDTAHTKTANLQREREFWFLCGDKSIIYNYANNTWYVYDSLGFAEVLETSEHIIGFTEDGAVKELSRAYRNDDGEAINAYCATGAMDFGRDWQLKYSPYLFVAMEPEDGGRINVSVESNKRSDYPVKTVASAFITYLNADFEHWSFGTNRKPQTRRIKIKVKKATYYKLIFSSQSTSATATVLQADIQMRFAGKVK